MIERDRKEDENMRGLLLKKQTSWIMATILGLQSFAFTLIPTNSFTSKHRDKVDPGFSAARSMPVESAAPNPRYGCGEVGQQSKEDAEAQRKIAETLLTRAVGRTRGENSPPQPVRPPTRHRMQETSRVGWILLRSMNR